MKTLLQAAVMLCWLICCVLSVFWIAGCLTGCGTQKPWTKAADMQPHERQLTVNVFYGDYSKEEVQQCLESSSEEFYGLTNFHIVKANYYPIVWQSKQLDKMTAQATQEWELRGKPPCHWYIFVYRRNLATKIVTPLFFVLGIGLPRGWSTTGECGNTMFVDNLNKKIWIHEFYHLGWGWGTQCEPG